MITTEKKLTVLYAFAVCYSNRNKFETSISGKGLFSMYEKFSKKVTFLTH